MSFPKYHFTQHFFTFRMKRFFIFLILATTALADNLDDLQKLARQLNEVRMERQTAQDAWKKTNAATTVLLKQLQAETRHTIQKTQETREKTQNVKEQLKTTRQQINQAEQKLQLVRNQLRKHQGALTQQAQRLPEHLRKTVLTELDAIKKLGDDPLALPEQLKRLLALGNAISQNAKTLTKAPALIPALKREYNAIYFGCAWAVALAPDASAAAIGFPTDSEWTWQEANQHLPEIVRFFQIVNNRAPADLVTLPIKLNRK